VVAAAAAAAERPHMADHVMVDHKEVDCTRVVGWIGRGEGDRKCHLQGGTDDLQDVWMPKTNVEAEAEAEVQSAMANDEEEAAAVEGVEAAAAAEELAFHLDVDVVRHPAVDDCEDKRAVRVEEDRQIAVDMGISPLQVRSTVLHVP